MCIVLDTNTFHRFRDPDNVDMEPVRKWLNSRYGKIAYSTTARLKSEWDLGGMKHTRDQLMRAGKLKLVPKGEHREKENELKGKTESDDAHIIALALVAGVKVLVSGDTALIRDFKARVRRGKVYTKKAHVHLLTKDTCP